LIGASIVSGKRCYARAAAGFQSPRNKRMSSRPRQQQQQQMHRGGPSTSQLTLGRVAKQCVPTELLREPAVPKDPWKDRDPRLVNPIQVNMHSGLLPVHVVCPPPSDLIFAVSQHCIANDETSLLEVGSRGEADPAHWE
jgi:hypothetical protein